MFVSGGCCHKLPLGGALKQQTLIRPQFWGWSLEPRCPPSWFLLKAVPPEDASVPCFSLGSWGLTTILDFPWLVAVSSHRREHSLYLHLSLSPFSLFRKTQNNGCEPTLIQLDLN